MRILHVTRDFPPPTVGGISTAVHGIVAGQPGHWRSSVISFDGWRPRKNDSPRPVAEERAGKTAVARISGPGQLGAASQWCATQRADLVVIHDAMLWEFAMTLQTVRRAFVLHVAHAQAQRVRGKPLDTLSVKGESRALAEADVVIAPSETAARTVRDHPLSPRNDVLVCELPLLLEPRTESLRSTNEVLYIGRYGDLKGTDVLAEALYALLEAHPHLCIRAIGGAPLSPKSQRRWERRLRGGAGDHAARLTLESWQSASAAHTRVARAALLIAPSRYETFGYAVLEAMHLGTPVVAARGGALCEWVTEERGWSFKPGCAAALVEAVNEVLARADEAALRARQARKWARKRFATERIGARWNEVLSSVERG